MCPFLSLHQYFDAKWCHDVTIVKTLVKFKHPHGFHSPFTSQLPPTKSPSQGPKHDASLVLCQGKNAAGCHMHISDVLKKLHNVISTNLLGLLSNHVHIHPFHFMKFHLGKSIPAPWFNTLLFFHRLTNEVLNDLSQTKLWWIYPSLQNPVFWSLSNTWNLNLPIHDQVRCKSPIKTGVLVPIHSKPFTGEITFPPHHSTETVASQVYATVMNQLVRKKLGWPNVALPI